MAKQNSAPDVGVLVRVYNTHSDKWRVCRVQDHLSIQFTYSEPHNDEVVGICLNNGDWEYDYTTEDIWKKQSQRAQEDGTPEPAQQDRGRDRVVEETPSWDLRRGRRRKIGQGESRGRGS